MTKDQAKRIAQKLRQLYQKSQGKELKKTGQLDLFGERKSN